MNDNGTTEIIQKAGVGSDVTQIGTQIVYKGLSPNEACKLATDLFYENFPKLREEAVSIASSRVEELMKNVEQKLIDGKIADMSAFAEPDVQYALYEAQKSYARFGTKEMLSTLASLLAKRVKHNDDNICLKVAIDRAIEISGLLSSEHLDYLALLFSVGPVHFKGVNNVEQLKALLLELESSFPGANSTCYSHLLVMNCLQLVLFDAEKHLSEEYKLPIEQVRAICPKKIQSLSGDYMPSHIGIALAIAHLENKTRYRFNPAIWIHS